MEDLQASIDCSDPENLCCRRCGHRGALLQMPSHHSLELSYLPFPVEEGLGRRAQSGVRNVKNTESDVNRRENL